MPLLVGLLCMALIEPNRPNILWLTNEDHGPHWGCYGDTVAQTPTADDLAGKGLRYQRVWSVAPVCAPARTAILTGAYPSALGALAMRSAVRLPPDWPLFPIILQANGYYCTNNYKTDYNVFTSVNLWNESSPKAHWKNRRPDQPFFAIFNSQRSHESQIRVRPHRLKTDPAQVRLPAYHPDTPEVRQDWAQYYDQVSAADAEAGNHLRELTEAGLAENTIVFYFSDHGSAMPRNKRWPGNAGLQVPLIVYFPPAWRHLAPPDFAPGSASQELISFVDLAPTVLSLAGVKPSSAYHGRAFAGKYRAPNPAFLFGERGRMDEAIDCVRTATDGRYVYLRNYLPYLPAGQFVTYQWQTPTTRVWKKLFDEKKTNSVESAFWQQPRPIEELYDLTKDPDEVENLAKSEAHQAILARFQRAVNEHQHRHGDWSLVPESIATPLLNLSGKPRPTISWHELVNAAEAASRPDRWSFKDFQASCSAPDPAVRFWGVMGVRLATADDNQDANALLREKLADPVHEIVIAAASALVARGKDDAKNTAIRRLAELADARSTDTITALEALAAVVALDSAARAAWPIIATYPEAIVASPSRYDEYGPLLRQRLRERIATVR